ncbi:MAG TPA: hypothetical protein VIP77_12460, partial [Jiangellaceae bacterium]
MARDHARVKTSIWNDPDFLELKISEQHCYLALMSNKGLSYCGVIDYVPGRFAYLAADMSQAKFKTAVAGLVKARFVIVDEHTQELLLRTYVRHDGVLDRVNMGKATGTAIEAVVSWKLREAIGRELRHLMKDASGLPGW